MADTAPDAGAGAQKGVDARKKEEELIKAVGEDLNKIHEVSWKTSRGSYAQCTWDVGAGVEGPGNTKGGYVRQCKKAALLNMDKQLCQIHAKKFYLQDAREKTAQLTLQKGDKLRLTSAQQGVFQPRNALATVAEWKKFKTEKAQSCSVKLTPDQGVYTMEDAMCAIAKAQ